MLKQEPAKECDQAAGDHLFVSAIISKSDVSTTYIEVFPNLNHFQGLNHFVSFRKRQTFCQHVVSFLFGWYLVSLPCPVNTLSASTLG